MALTSYIVKQNGVRRSEQFSREKLRASLVAACLSVRTPIGQAEAIAQDVVEKVIDWLENKPEVTSHDIRLAAAKHLEEYHPDAAYMYQQYRITI